MADGRKSHVVRIYGKNRDGSPNVDTYADILRTDTMFITAKDQHGYQQVRWTVNWGDGNDETDAELNNNPARKTHTLKLWDPTRPPADPLDPDDFIPVEVIDQCVIRGWVGAYFTVKGKDVHLKYHQETKLNFHNDWDGTEVKETTRKVKNVRVTKHTTTADGELTSDDGSSRKVDADSYQLLDEDDPSQYVEEELITQYFNKWSQQHVSLANVLLNKPDQDSGPLAEIQFSPVDAQGQNSDGTTLYPYRLDPFQIIVNVSWSNLDQQYLLGKFHPQFGFDLFTLGTGDVSAQATDGTTWSDKTHGASGLGWTVINSGPIAFGELSLSDGTKQSCFMRAVGNIDPETPSTVEKGTLVDGSFVWETVRSYDKGVLAISFCNDSFFVSYITDISDPDNFLRSSNFDVTKDGTWTTIEGPISGGGTASDGVLGMAGKVAYNKKSKTYAAVGSHFWPPIGEISGSGFNDGLMWCWSSDGFSWSQGQDGSTYSQPGGTPFLHNSTICAGNGIFVCSLNKKCPFPETSTLFVEGEGVEVVQIDPYVLPQSAVGTSVDGSIWTLHVLPGANVSSGGDGSAPSDGDVGSDTFAVAFIEDKSAAGSGVSGFDDTDPTDKPTGYFVAAGWENGSIPGYGQYVRLWKSFDGAGWELIQEEHYAEYTDTVSICGISVIDKKLNNVLVM